MIPRSRQEQGITDQMERKKRKIQNVARKWGKKGNTYFGEYIRIC